jgi:hypothetical protein
MFDNEINLYLEHIYNNFAGWYNRAVPSVFDEHSAEHVKERLAEFKANLRFEEGNKYIKVIQDKSVHSFIVKKDDNKFKAGDILKAASWAAPAKNFARGNILNNNYNNVTWTGA